MTDIGRRASRRRRGYAWLAAGPVAAGAVALAMAAQPAFAATAPGLGTAGSFAVLAATTVTNTGASIISGDLGVSPGSAVTGFPPGQVINGTMEVADAVAATAQDDLTTAYNNAAGQSPTVNVPSTIGSAGIDKAPLVPGVYKASSSLEVSGALTLDAGGNPNAVWIFQAPSSTLTTDSGSSVVLTNGAQACNVFWQVGSSATLGTDSTFQGNILANTSITVDTGDTITGRALASGGAVTLDDDTITAPGCTTGPGTPPTGPGTPPTGPGTPPTGPGTPPTGPGTPPTSPAPHPTGPATTATTPAPTRTSPAPRPPTSAPAPTPVSAPFPVTG
jgi:hypothetical protein